MIAKPFLLWQQPLGRGCSARKLRAFGDGFTNAQAEAMHSIASANLDPKNSEDRWDKAGLRMTSIKKDLTRCVPGPTLVLK